MATTFGDSHVLNGSATTASSDEESDEGSIFQVIGDQGNGVVSCLCAHCQYIFENWSTGFQNWSKCLNEKVFRFPHYRDTFQLEISAATGCALCAQFLQSVDAHNLREARDEMKELGLEGFDAPSVWAHTDPLFLAHRKTFAQRDEKVILEMPFLRHPALEADDDLEYDMSREIIKFEVEMIPAVVSNLVPCPEDRPITNTVDSLALASRWLKKCRESHWQCNPLRERFTPTRLISTKENEARLCEGRDFREPPEYATLSHCWGKTKFPTLKRSNLEIFKNRIPQEALSQTFHHSLTIARALGFSYIWIDSLCILQDEPDDWARESSSMSLVYGSSGVNIAASGAVDGSSGCFFERLHTWRCQIQIKSEDRIYRYDCIPRHMYYISLSHMPLVSRGWALQERLLPSRTLHFTSTQIFWECHQKVACEIFPEEFPPSLAYSSCYFKQPISRSMWSWIIETYTNCELTYAEDKFVAISGLARIIQIQTGDQYIAGMWRKDLEFQLCWKPMYGLHDGQRVTPYRAPTWSWASLDCPIAISTPERNNETRENTTLWIQILDIQLQFSGSDPLGQLSMAKLCLSCSCLLHVTFQIGDEKDYMIVAGNYIKATISFDCSGEANDSKLHKALAMPVYGCSTSASGRIGGLILEPTRQEQGQYCRIGSFYLYKQKLSKAFENASAERSCLAGSAEFFRIRKDKYGKIHQIINIV